MSFKRFKINIQTRWNSTYEMLKSVEGYENILTEFYNLRMPHNPLTQDDWHYAKVICAFLETFCSATQTFSSVYTPTSHRFLEFIVAISNYYCEYKQNPTFETLVNIMEVKFLKYWADIPILYCLATIMDPRIKKDGLFGLLDVFQDNFILDDLNISDLKQTVNDVLFNLYCLYDQKYGTSSSSATQQSQASGSVAPKRNFYLGFMTKRHKSVQPQSDYSELNFYLHRDVAGKMSDDELLGFDILEWWKSKQSTYPVLSAMARDILTTPVSTVASESAFSAGNRVLGDRRSRLTTEAVEVCVCLKDWLDAEDRSQGETISSPEEEEEQSSSGPE